MLSPAMAHCCVTRWARPAWLSPSTRSTTGTFVSPGTTANGGTANANSNLPVSGTTVTVGEVFAFFNTFDFLFRVTDSEEFGYGFSGFVPEQGSTKVVGQIKAMVNLECVSPRTQKQFYGIGG